MKTTARTLWLWAKGSPVARRVTEGRDGLFRSIGSGTAKDFGGDPSAWMVATSDHVTRVAMDDVEGFRLVKGTASAAKLEASSHTWKELTTLGEFVKLDHPLNKGACSIEKITEAYTALRAIEDAS